MIKKSLLELSLNISEELYREMPNLSYSTLARYEKGGFSSIPKLFDKVESESITFGSIVDTIMTEGEENLHKKFIISDFEVPTESVKNVIDNIFDSFESETFDGISDSMIVAACNAENYQTNWKDDTRVKKIRELGTEYFNLLSNARGKTIVSSNVYSTAKATVEALRTNKLSSRYFKITNPVEDMEYLYQTKFSTTINDIDLKCMFDILIVDHKNKTIIPVDLKTTSSPEYDFAKKFLEFRYDIQSRLYYRILDKIIKEDDYFKDFNLCHFRFIVINKDRNIPLVFIDSKCNQLGDVYLTFQSKRETVLRDPIDIAKELMYYLDNQSFVPKGIFTESTNDIYERIKLL